MFPEIKVYVKLSCIALFRIVLLINKLRRGLIKLKGGDNHREIVIPSKGVPLEQLDWEPRSAYECL